MLGEHLGLAAHRPLQLVDTPVGFQGFSEGRGSGRDAASERGGPDRGQGLHEHLRLNLDHKQAHRSALNLNISATIRKTYSYICSQFLKNL